MLFAPVELIVVESVTQEHSPRRGLQVLPLLKPHQVNALLSEIGFSGGAAAS
jgi:hypothetical protein